MQSVEKICPTCGKSFVDKKHPDKIACSKKCIVQSQHKKEKISAKVKASWEREDSRQKRVDGIKKAWADPDVKARIGTAIKTALNNPEIKEKRIIALNTPEVKEKQSESSKELWKNEDHRRHVSDSLGEYWKTAEADERRQRVGETLSDPEIVKRRALSMTGEGNPNWCGGSSYKGYCVVFKVMREPIRNAFSNTCVACGTKINKSGRKLSAHHPTYDKSDGCKVSDMKLLGIPLCDSCHAKSNSIKDRDLWVSFSNDIFGTEYLGIACYYEPGMFLIPFRKHRVPEYTYLGTVIKTKTAYY